MTAANPGEASAKTGSEVSAQAGGGAPMTAKVRSIALFFLFALMDEKVALEAAQKTTAQLKATRSRNFAENEAGLGEAELIFALGKAYAHYRKSVPRNRPATVPASAWRLDDATDLSAWSRFQKEATEVEMVAVIFSKILGFKDEAIAEGLNLSIGTVRYRIGKGVRHLGQIARHNSMSKKV